MSEHSGGGRQADNRRGHLDRQDRFLLLFNDSPLVAGPGQRLVLIANSELKTSLDATCETATLNRASKTEYGFRQHLFIWLDFGVQSFACL